jgi:YfiH family protein
MTRDAERWRWVLRAGLTLAQNVGLAGIEGVSHGFSSKGSGDAEFDLGDGAPDRDRRLRLLERALSLAPGSVRLLRQVHGSRIVEGDDPTEPTAADGIVARRGAVPPRSPAVRVADCVPVLLGDAERGRAVAAVHAGWRGTAQAVARRAVEALAELGVPPRALRAAVGPAVGPCCYEVGADVLQAVAAAVPDPREVAVFPPGAAKPRLDLPGANAAQLRAAGLRPEAVEIAPWCTVCAADLFFSHRRDGPAAGRMVACVGFDGAPPGSP